MTPSRREFLLTGSAALAGFALAACNKSGSPAATPTTMAGITKGKQANLQIVAAQPNIKRSNDRLSLGLLSTDGKPYAGGTARAWLATSQDSPLIGPVDLTFRGGGDFPSGVYTGRVSFATAGRWLVYVEAKPDGVSHTVQNGTTLEVGTAGPISGPGSKPQPIPGQQAISVPTPTVADHRGVAPICTRTPACSMHQVSLDQALAAHKPVALVIGTPAFCQSRTCGPVVDELLKAKPAFAGRVEFIHVEVYKDNRDAPAKQILAPAAAAWHLETEPAVYYITKTGRISDWTVGASDAAEITELAKTLL